MNTINANDKEINSDIELVVDNEKTLETVTEEISKTDKTDKNDNDDTLIDIPVGEVILEYKRILAIISDKIKTAVISPSTLTKLIILVMEEMETSTIKGIERKTIAVKIIRELITDNKTIDPEVKKICLEMIDTGIVENTIELIIDATHGNLNINNVKKVANGCLINCLTSCFIK